MSASIASYAAKVNEEQVVGLAVVGLRLVGLVVDGLEVVSWDVVVMVGFDEGRGVGTLFGLTVVGRIVLGLNVVGLVDDGFDVGMSVVVDDGLRDVGLVVGILSRVGEYVG